MIDYFIHMAACTSAADAPLQGELTGRDDMRVYPNPATEDVYINWQHIVEKAEIRVYTSLGIVLQTNSVENTSNAKINIPSLGVSGNQLLFLSVKADGKDYGVQRVMIN
jgi:hypothetical protein